MKTPLPTLPHIGLILAKHVRRHRYYRAALARDIGVSRETIDYLFKRPDTKVSTVWKICFALRYNFLSDLAAQLPPDMPCAPTPKDERIAELEEQVRQLTSERDNLQQVLDILREK